MTTETLNVGKLSQGMQMTVMKKGRGDTPNDRIRYLQRTERQQFGSSSGEPAKTQGCGREGSKGKCCARVMFCLLNIFFFLRQRGREGEKEDEKH